MNPDPAHETHHAHDAHDARDAHDAPAGPLPAGEALDHFWNAAHEFLGALRVLLDAADSYVEEQRRPPAPAAPRVRRIDIE